jgi:glycosyltransferase involved in cell wall biosynthesis
MFRRQCEDLVYSMRAVRALPGADILVTNTFWLPVIARRPRLGKLYVHIARFPKRQMFLYHHAARLQAVSTPVAEAVRRQTPRVAHKVRAVPNVLPVEQFSRSPMPPRRTEPPLVLYVGRVHPEKGLDLLINAAAKLSQPHRLRIVGPWDTKLGGGGDAYREQLQRLPGAESVEFTGAVFGAAQLNAHFDSATLFVYPSLAEQGETFGLAPLEAMARSRVALVSDLPCFREFLREGENGFVFNHRATDSTAALAAKLAEALGAPEERLATMALRAHATAEEFALPRVADRYLEDFQTLLD